MEDTLLDLANTLLLDEDFERAHNFLRFYNLTYPKKHSREARVFLTSCCSLVFCRLLRGEIEDIGWRLCNAYINSTQEAVECWGDDDESNLQVAMTSALVLLRVWLEKFHESATDDQKSKLKIVTANLCLLVSNPSVTLLKRACSLQTLRVPHFEDAEEVLLGPHSKTIDYLFRLGCPLALPDELEESLPNLVVRTLYENAENLLEVERMDGMECVNILEGHGLQVDWGPIEHMRGAIQSTNL